MARLEAAPFQNVHQPFQNAISHFETSVIVSKRSSVMLRTHGTTLECPA
jgi:hypothetical protein